MRSRAKLLAASSGALFTLAALVASDANAQAGRGMAQTGNSGTMRQGYQGGAAGQRLPFSTGAGRGGQQGGFGSRNARMAGGAGMDAGVGGGAVGDGPMSSGLAQGASGMFQEGGFVGRDAEDVRTGFQSQFAGRGSGGMLDSMIENLNEMRDSRRRWREQNSAPPPIRVRLQPAFDLPVLPAGQANLEIQSRLTDVMELRGVASPQVEIAGRTATLRGAVATERDRALLERLASLEPGVSEVKNLVTIQPQLVLPPPLPPR
jgi:hypothetical protein